MTPGWLFFSKEYSILEQLFLHSLLGERYAQKVVAGMTVVSVAENSSYLQLTGRISKQQSIDSPQSIGSVFQLPTLWVHELLHMHCQCTKFMLHMRTHVRISKPKWWSHLKRMALFSFHFYVKIMIGYGVHH